MPIIRTDPKSLQFRVSLAELYWNLGNLDISSRQHSEAVKAFEQALELWKQLVEEFPEDVQFRQKLASTYNNLGGLHITAGDLKEAESNLNSGLESLLGLVADNAATPSCCATNLIKIYINLALM